MKIRNVKAREQCRSVVMSLTGFVEAGKEYIVREVFIKGEPAVLITEAYSIERVCPNCGEDFKGSIIGDLCEKCESAFNISEGGE